jgi:hypothetical protein
MIVGEDDRRAWIVRAGLDVQTLSRRPTDRGAGFARMPNRAAATTLH